jgi:soluble lytic murein transglycosylase-like protein
MPFDEIIKNCSQIYGIEERLIRAIIRKESSWNPWAIRVERGFWRRYWVGIKALFIRTPEKDERWLAYPDLVATSYGLMQIMLTTAMELGFRFQYPTELLDPETNINYGCLLLKKNYKQYGNWQDAISAYNQGNPRKDKNGRYCNQQYVDTVVQFWKKNDDV